MFCENCGAKLIDQAKFCAKCGTPVQSEEEQTEILPQNEVENQAESIHDTRAERPEDIVMPVIPPTLQPPVMAIPAKAGKGKGKKAASIIVLLLVALGLIGAIAYFAPRYLQQNQKDLSFEGQLAKAEQCMDEENYEDAVGYYLKALELDDKNEAVYEGLVQAYEHLNKVSQAVRMAEQGYGVTNSAKLKEMFDRLSEITANEEDGGEDAGKQEAAEAVPMSEKQAVNIDIRQVDNSNFPEVTFYATVTDEAGNTVEKLNKTDFAIKEIDTEGNVKDAQIEDVYQVLNQDKVNVNLVLDASDSMDAANKMQQAKNAAKTLISKMRLTGGDQVEVISFDSYVYLEQEFTSRQELLDTAISGITTQGMTALYDALYAGLLQTYYEDGGAKCVIGFTDGAENASSYTFNDVVAMAQNSGIPVFIIGIGEEYDVDELQNLASQCSGKYYSANVNDLQSILENIYLTIYQEQQECYVFKYTSPDTARVDQFRQLKVETSETSEFYGSYVKDYIPQADISGAFSSSYMSLDYILDFSSQRTVTEQDLVGLSLAELRIARNEIFARHGRQFKDSMLNQWFYSKAWYLNIGSKYAPDSFDVLSPSPLSKLEIDNANYIKDYENQIMDNRDIYPDASNTPLTEYDLALSKAVLKRALLQLQGYPTTDVLNQNKSLIQQAIDKEEITY